MKTSLRSVAMLPPARRTPPFDSRVTCNADMDTAPPDMSPMTAVVCWAGFWSQDDSGPRTYGAVIHETWRFLCRIDPEPAPPGEPNGVERARELVASALADPRGPLSVIGVSS